MHKSLALFGMGFLPRILAQEPLLQQPIYVPFGWNQVPQNASIIGIQNSTTTYAMIDGGTATASPTLGPATIVQSGSVASMYYANSVGTATPTLSGVCNLASPVAVCTLNVYTTGAALPGGGEFASSSGGPGSASGEQYISGSSGGFRSNSWVDLGPSIATVALSFCIGYALVR